jgi:hypothetical protein
MFARPKGERSIEDKGQPTNSTSASPIPKSGHDRRKGSCRLDYHRCNHCAMWRSSRYVPGRARQGGLLDIIASQLTQERDYMR